MLVAGHTSGVLWLDLFASWDLFSCPESIQYYGIFRCTLWTVLNAENIGLICYNNYHRTISEGTVEWHKTNCTEFIIVPSSFCRRSVYSFFSAGVRRGLSVIRAKQGFRASDPWYGELYYIASHVHTCEVVKFLPCSICAFCTVPASSSKAYCGSRSRGHWRPCTGVLAVSTLAKHFIKLRGEILCFINESLLMRDSPCLLFIHPRCLHTLADNRIRNTVSYSLLMRSAASLLGEKGDSLHLQYQMSQKVWLVWSI